MNAIAKRRVPLLSIAILVAALGYFVDIYDLLLFGIIRLESLRSLGLTESAITEAGESILSWQMIGLMIGGVIAGIISDKRGRLSVLFGSILLYSLANIANGMVETVLQYKIIRFLAGLGLAGELGVGITLVSELIPKERRGVATSFVAGIGLTGAVVAFIIKQHFDWRTCYFIGGGLGILLLLLRISVHESGLFKSVKAQNISRGNFLQLFTNKDRLQRYVCAVLIGLPTWYVIGILVTFAPEFGKQMGIQGTIDPGEALMYAYAAISIGDIVVGLVSQQLRSRKKALYIFYGLTILFIVLFFTSLWEATPQHLYWICAGLGFATGFWAIFVTMGAEQFGTNLRGTAATTIPNMVRGLLSIFIIPLFKLLREWTGYVNGAWITGAIIMVITLMAAYYTRETFGKDLNYVEI